MNSSSGNAEYKAITERLGKLIAKVQDTQAAAKVAARAITGRCGPISPS